YSSDSAASSGPDARRPTSCSSVAAAATSLSATTPIAKPLTTDASETGGRFTSPRFDDASGKGDVARLGLARASPRPPPTSPATRVIRGIAGDVEGYREPNW